MIIFFAISSQRANSVHTSHKDNFPYTDGKSKIEGGILGYISNILARLFRLISKKFYNTFVRCYESQDHFKKSTFSSSVRANDSQKIFILVGPPASGKTMFLFCLERLKSTKYLVGSRVTKAGLAKFLFTNKPRILLLDEIDKMDAEHYGILLGLCESGRVTELLGNRDREILLNTTVFACCNKMDKLPPEIVSRFEVIKFRKYSKKEFRHVVTELLQRMGKRTPGWHHTSQRRSLTSSMSQIPGRR